MNARSVLIALAAVVLFVSRSARADELHYYAVRDAHIVVDDRQDAEVPCLVEEHVDKHTVGLVVSGAHLYVACGSEGTVTYSLADPMHPVMTGRVEVFSPNGQLPQTFKRGVVNPTMRDAGIAFVAVGGVAVVAGVVLLLDQLGRALAAFDGCFFGGCAQSGPAASIGVAGAVVTGAGVLTALIGIPLLVSGGHRTVTAYASAGGGGVRVTF